MERKKIGRKSPSLHYYTSRGGSLCCLFFLQGRRVLHALDDWTHLQLFVSHMPTEKRLHESRIFFLPLERRPAVVVSVLLHCCFNPPPPSRHLGKHCLLRQVTTGHE